MNIQTLTILVGTSVCNAQCPYCISKMTPKQGMSMKLDKVDWINFDKAARLSQINKVSTVLFTGKGEPLLYPDRLTEYFERIKKFDFPLIEVQTNALVLGESWNKYLPYLKKWRNLGLNTIAISVVHYDKEKNKKIYTPDREYMDLEKVIFKLHELGFSVRLSCIMLKGFIDSSNEIKKFVKKAKAWKVEQLTLRPVTTPTKSESKEVYSWTKKRELSNEQLNECSEFLNNNANKLMCLCHGAIVYDYCGQNVCLTNALTIEPSKDEIRQLIFFPDGHLRYDWQFEGAVLI